MESGQIRLTFDAGTDPVRDQPRQAIGVQDLAVVEARQTAFERIGAFGQAPVNLATDQGRPERFSGGQLTVSACEALGVIVNESFARAHFARLDPLRRQMKRIRPGSKVPWLTIVGVVPDLIPSREVLLQSPLL
jgi:hypothetical protein